MEDKLVTLAIHTYQKALMLKMFLENEGIEVYLHNVNLIQPVVSSGVRVRIKESDLPQALKLIEKSDFFKELEEQPDREDDKEKTQEKVVLIPIDFSDYSLKACELGFNFASIRGAVVHITHAYYSPVFPASFPFGDNFVYQGGDEETIQVIYQKVQAEMQKFKSLVDEKIHSGEWNHVSYTYSLREGLPEEEIIAVSKELDPILIIMGTRGKNQKDLDLIGSITAEVIERVKSNVFAVPENISFTRFSQIQRVAFGTSFDQKDLVAVDALIKTISATNIQFYLFHISHKPDAWDEIKLAGIKEYFAKQYPDMKINYDIIDANDFVFNLEKFIRTNQIDVISLTTYRRNIISRMFNPSMARRMLFHTDTPLLVLRG